MSNYLLTVSCSAGSNCTCRIQDLTGDPANAVDHIVNELLPDCVMAAGIYDAG